MSKFIGRWLPRDIIALVALILSYTLMMRGEEGIAEWTYYGIIAGYLGLSLAILEGRKLK